MKRILQAIHAVDGVQGSLVVDANGQILAYQAHAIYDGDLIALVGQTIVSTADSVRLLYEDWETLSANFAEGTVIMRSIRPSVEGVSRTVILGIIGDNHLNPSFAGVAMRVAATKLKSRLESPDAADQVGSNPNPMESNPRAQGLHAGGVSTSMATPPPVPNTPPPRAANDLASSGVSWSGLGSTAKVGGDLGMADPESTAFLGATTKALSATVGPMAKVYVKESVRRLCGDRLFSRTQWDALIADVGKQIQDPSAAAQFQKTMRARY